MKNKIALFGAGNNCRGVIKFLGKENICVIIDNDTRRWGTQIQGIEVISLYEYIRKKVDMPVLITITTESGRKSVRKQLKNEGINLFYYAPFIQFGFYSTVKKLVIQLEMDQLKPVFYGNNPITDKITEELKRQSIEYDIYDCVEEDYPILNRELEKEHLINKERLTSERTLFITDGKQHEVNDINNKIIDILEQYKKYFLPSHKELRQFKNIHKGKRCFLIGNGPSLTYDDLEVLRTHGEITFGVNRIYLSFEKTKWRPDYYVAVDSIVIEQDAQIIKKYNFSAAFIGDNYSEDLIFDKNNFHYFSRMPNYFENDSFSLDIEKYIFGGNTVIYDAMQIAVYMGFREIIILGVDMTQTGQGESIPHFYEISNQEKERQLTKGNIENPLKAFSIAKEVAEKQDVKILNATRGGNVEIFERVNFENLF